MPFLYVNCFTSRASLCFVREQNRFWLKRHRIDRKPKRQSNNFIALRTIILPVNQLSSNTESNILFPEFCVLRYEMVCMCVCVCVYISKCVGSSDPEVPL